MEPFSATFGFSLCAAVGRGGVGGGFTLHPLAILGTGKIPEIEGWIWAGRNSNELKALGEGGANYIY